MLGLLPAAVHAQETSSLKIAPTKFEEMISAGQPKDGFVDLFNVGQTPITVISSVENIRMIGDAGDIDYYIGDNPYRLHNFVQIDPAPFTMAPNEARRVPFRVSVPPGVYPGGYFGSLLFSIVPPDAAGDQTVIRQSGRVGSLLILTVEGDSAKTGELTRAERVPRAFGTRQDFTAVYRNTGNTDQRPLGLAYRPTGQVRVTDTFGRQVAQTKLDGDIVFPDAERKISFAVNRALWFGRYTAEITLSPPDGGQPTSKRIHFWAISPLALLIWGVIVAAGTLAALSFWAQRRKPAPNAPTRSVSLLDEVAKTDTPSSTRPPTRQPPKKDNSTKRSARRKRP